MAAEYPVRGRWVPGVNIRNQFFFNNRHKVFAAARGIFVVYNRWRKVSVAHGVGNAYYDHIGYYAGHLLNNTNRRIEVRFAVKDIQYREMFLFAAFGYVY